MTQRKFLRLTAGFAETMTTRAYPRLFAVDFIREKEKSAQELLRIEIANQMNSQHAQHVDNKEDNARDEEAERQRDKKVREAQRQAQPQDEPPPEKVKKLCIRALCENEENWHASGSPFEITDKVILQNSVCYLTRIMLLLKQSDLALEILTTEEGEAELRKLDEVRIEKFVTEMNFKLVSLMSSSSVR